jgi:hypothetical protein
MPLVKGNWDKNPFETQLMYSFSGEKSSCFITLKNNEKSRWLLVLKEEKMP